MRTRITPDVHTFGEPVVATVDVVADAGFIKPGDDSGRGRLRALRARREPTVERECRGRHRARRLPLPAALPPGGLRRRPERAASSQFAPGSSATAIVRGPGPGRHIDRLAVQSRSPRASGAPISKRLRWRASETTLPARRCGSGPVAARGRADRARARCSRRGASGSPGGSGAARPGQAVTESVEPRTPLERALDLVLADSRNGSTSARAAPDAREARPRAHGGSGEDGLAEDARELAWSPRAASGDDVAGFARRVTEMRPEGGGMSSIQLGRRAPADLGRGRARSRAPADAAGAARASPRSRIALLAAALLLSRDLEALPTSYFATGSGGVVVLDLSSSVDELKAQRVQRVLRSLAETEGRVGLVVFSDTAYEMCPRTRAARSCGRCCASSRRRRGYAGARSSRRRPMRPAARPARGEPVVALVPRRHEDLDRARRGALDHPPRRGPQPLRPAAQRPRQLRASTARRSSRRSTQYERRGSVCA